MDIYVISWTTVDQVIKQVIFSRSFIPSQIHKMRKTIIRYTNILKMGGVS